MRIETKLSVLERVASNHIFTIDAESIMNGQNVVIRNWRDVRTAVQILREMDWLPPDGDSQLLDDYLANRDEADTLEVSIGEYQELERVVHRYDDGLPVLLSTLRTHSVSTNPSVVWVEIKSASDPGELAKTAEEISRALVIAGQAGHAFRFVGVAQGSNWFGFEPMSALMGDIINYCIHLASSIVEEIQRVPSTFLTSMVRLSLEDSGNSNPTQDDIDDHIDRINERTVNVLTDAGAKELLELLKGANYTESEQNQASSAVKLATKAIIDMGQGGRATFEPSEGGRNFVINVYGNERVEINNFQVTERQPDALPPPNSEE